MVAKNGRRKEEESLPCIGIWNLTKTCDPSPGNTLVGLWLGDRPGEQRIEFFAAFFCRKDGECVDPDEEEWDHITFHSRQGKWIDNDSEIAPPDYWAEARWLIPGWGD
jgi:hypothetical protein